MQADGAGAALVLLAAGAASRFGGNKLVARLNGRSVAGWAMTAADIAASGGAFERKIIVCRDGAFSCLPAECGWTRIVNPRADEGMGASIRIGVAAVRDCRGAVIALADMPFVTPDHLALLAGSAQVTFTAYPDGAKGCPAWFPRDSFSQLLDLRGDRGAASLAMPDARTIAPKDSAILRDVDTQAQLAAFDQG